MDTTLPHLTSRATKLQTGPNPQCWTIPSRHCLADLFKQRTTLFTYELTRNNCVNTASLNRSKPGGTAALLSCILLGIPRKHNAITLSYGVSSRLMTIFTRFSHCRKFWKCLLGRPIKVLWKPRHLMSVMTPEYFYALSENIVGISLNFVHRLKE